jgi:hypothetical protein
LDEGQGPQLVRARGVAVRSALDQSGRACGPTVPSLTVGQMERTVGVESVTLGLPSTGYMRSLAGVILVCRI